MDRKTSDMLGGEAESILPSNSSPDDVAEKTSSAAGGASTVTPYVIQARSRFDSRLQLRVTMTVTPIYDSEEKEKIISKDAAKKFQSNDIRKSVEYVDGKKKKEAHGHTLPDELVERIISRMPFPALFKARALSRSWYFKFPPPSLRISTIRSTFQNHVTAVSGNWTSYCPMFITADNEIKGFDRSLSRWRRVVDLHYLDQDLNLPLASLRSCAGPLVSFASGESLVVTNALTKGTRTLRKPFPRRYFLRLILEGSHAYKILAGKPDIEGRYSSDYEDFAVSRVQELLVYDSETRRWTSRECSIPNTTVLARTFFEGAVYVNGKLYGIGEVQTCLQIWSYNVEDGTWCLVLDRQDVKCGLGGVGGLVYVGDRVMLALCSCSANGREKVTDEMIESVIWYICPNSIEIFELCQIDFGTLELTQVAKGPPQAIAVLGGPRNNFESTVTLSSDANFMYFSRHRSNCNIYMVTTFDLHSHEWGSLSTKSPRDFAPCGRVQHMIPSFEPGLCPLLMA